MKITNGILLDPSQSLHTQKDLCIQEGKISQEAKGPVLDARGLYVLPGLIDHHTHVFDKASDAGYDPDLYCLPNGVTAVIDQGTSGAINFESFLQQVILPSKVDIKAYLNISSTGLISESVMENIDPQHFEPNRIKELFQQYPAYLLGLKIRLDQESMKDMGIKPLEKTVELANELQVPVSVHVKNSNVPLEEIARCLRKGDTWVHMYQLKEPTILNEKGEVRPALIEAKQRGVYFDVASGRRSFSFDMIQQAFAQGFEPDFLGTDLVRFNLYQKPIHSLLYTMSMYLNLGWSLEKTVEMCTDKVAKLMHSPLGTLQTGAQADITIVKLVEKEILFEDKHGGSLKGNKYLVPMCVIKKGDIVYRNMEM